MPLISRLSTAQHRCIFSSSSLSSNLVSGSEFICFYTVFGTMWDVLIHLRYPHVSHGYKMGVLYLNLALAERQVHIVQIKILWYMDMGLNLFLKLRWSHSYPKKNYNVSSLPVMPCNHPVLLDAVHKIKQIFSEFWHCLTQFAVIFMSMAVLNLLHTERNPK